MLRHALRRMPSLPAAPRPRSVSSVARPPTGEHAIVQAFRQGDLHTAITLFVQRPGHLRTPALHEAAILACARIPDAAAAHSLLSAMPSPTRSAVAGVVTALSRERDFKSALSVLNRYADSHLSVDDPLFASVARAADRASVPLPSPRRSSLGSSSSSSNPEPAGPRVVHQPSRKRLRGVLRAERRLRAASGDPVAVSAVWHALSESEPHLVAELGVLSAAVHAFLSRPNSSSDRALNTLMTWVRTHLLDPSTGSPASRYTSNPSSVALLLTASTKALAHAASRHPHLALSAYDVLNDIRLPPFTSSLPFTGTYFKILQHAHLPLPETRRRIDRAWAAHIQLDEQAFSMALGAILRCDARVADKLHEARLWLAHMRAAGIPLTVQTFNLFAGQLRYCNDPQSVTSLLSDMTKADVSPTAVTYGLIFSSCVMQGDYTSTARRDALPVALWNEVLQGMVDHMHTSSVPHSSYSLLSLARAHAHLGNAPDSLRVFDHFLDASRQEWSADQRLLSSKTMEGFAQVMFNLANCRDCSEAAPDFAIKLWHKASDMGLEPTAGVLDSLIIAAVRTGKARQAVDIAEEFLHAGHTIRLGVTGMKHLLKAQAHLGNAELWENTRPIVAQHEDMLSRPDLKSTVKALVVKFARSGRKDICEYIMSIGDVSVPSLDLVLSRREFSRFRERPSATPVDKPPANITASETETRVSSSFAHEPVLPLV